MFQRTRKPAFAIAFVGTSYFFGQNNINITKMKSTKKPAKELENLKYSPSKPLVFLFPFNIFKKGIWLSRVKGIIKN